MFAQKKMKTLPLRKFASSPMHSNSNTVAVQIKLMHKLTNTAEKRTDGMHLLESLRTKYRKVASNRLSWIVAHSRIFRLFMKGKFDAYVL